MRFGRTPRGRSQSISTIQSGTVATIIATMPDGTICSDHITAPFPNASINTPVIAALRHSVRFGAGCPRQRANA